MLIEKEFVFAYSSKRKNPLKIITSTCTLYVINAWQLHWPTRYLMKIPKNTFIKLQGALILTKFRIA